MSAPSETKMEDNVDVHDNGTTGDHDEMDLDLPEGCGLAVAEGGGVLSPLSGAYLLIVLSEPMSEQHKSKMIQKLRQGLLSWDENACHVDLASELDKITDACPTAEESRGGERLIQYASEYLVTEVLISPQLNTLQQCMKNMLGSFTKHRHILHGGYTFAGTGAWALQDGSYTYSNFTKSFEDYDIQRVMRAYENSITINLHCCEEGNWQQEHVDKEQFSEFCQVKLNPPEVDPKNDSVSSFINYLDKFLVPQSIQQILPPSDVVGNIRFTHPTLYVFPGGQGDSALFGINGFNLLVDGGFSRRACFWDFSRHLDRLDAVLITRVSDDNTGGMSALLQRKTTSALYPQIGHVFANLPSKCVAPDAATFQNEDDEDNANLIINVIEEGNSMLESLQILNLQPQVCLRDRDTAYKPINLYHKVGHGKLDMYVVNPSRDAKDLREFMERWNGENSKSLGTFRSGINVDGKELWLPLANLVSICALLVWLPDNPDDTVTRLLFPGSTPQNKVLKGLEKLRDLDFMQKPVCASKTVQKPKQAPQKRESSKYGYRSTSRKPVFKDTAKEKSLDSVGGSKENIEKVDNKPDVSSRKTSAAHRKEEKERREEKERKRKEEKRKLLEEEKQKMLKVKEEKERSEKIKRQQEKERRQQMKEVREKLEDKSRTPRRKVSEEKELKEQQNQAQATDSKGKEKSAGLKREKPIVTSRTKRTEAIKPAKPKLEQQKKQSITADKNASLPSSKLRKDASNKTKKEEVNKSKLETGTKIVKPKSKVSTAVAPAVKVEEDDIVPDKAPVNNEQDVGPEEEVESIVEKHQIEAMETSPLEEQVPDEAQRVIEDDIEPELQRIKDDEDDVNNEGLRVADIPVADGGIQLKHEPVEVVVDQLIINKEGPKMRTQHVKTPDEVPDLPEDEVVTEELDDNILETGEAKSPKEFEMEEKIALDLQEKEVQSEKDIKEEQVEIIDEPNASDVKNLLSPESEGAQEQKEVSEMLIRPPQVASIEEQQKEEVDEAAEDDKGFDEKIHPANIDNQSNEEESKINPDHGKEHSETEANIENELDDKHPELVKDIHSSDDIVMEEKLAEHLEACQLVPSLDRTSVDDTVRHVDVIGHAQELADKINYEITNLLSVLVTVEEICVKESNAVISHENTDEPMLKDIATSINDTHKLRDECNQFDIVKEDSTDICAISDGIECLVKRCIKMAIELIGNDTSLASELMEDVQKEADLVLQCKTAKLVCPVHATEDNDEYAKMGNENVLSMEKGNFGGSDGLEIDIPTNIKELKVQESKEQASPKSETQSIISADTSNRDMEDNFTINIKKDTAMSDPDNLPVPETLDKYQEDQKVDVADEVLSPLREEKDLSEVILEESNNETKQNIDSAAHIQDQIENNEVEDAEQDKTVTKITENDDDKLEEESETTNAAMEVLGEKEVCDVKEEIDEAKNEMEVSSELATAETKVAKQDQEEVLPNVITPLENEEQKTSKKAEDIAQEIEKSSIKGNDEISSVELESIPPAENVIVSELEDIHVNENTNDGASSVLSENKTAELNEYKSDIIDLINNKSQVILEEIETATECLQTATKEKTSSNEEIQTEVIEISSIEKSISEPAGNDTKEADNIGTSQLNDEGAEMVQEDDSKKESIECTSAFPENEVCNTDNDTNDIKKEVDVIPTNDDSQPEEGSNENSIAKEEKEDQITGQVETTKPEVELESNKEREGDVIAKTVEKELSNEKEVIGVESEEPMHDIVDDGLDTSQGMKNEDTVEADFVSSIEPEIEKPVPVNEIQEEKLSPNQESEKIPRDEKASSDIPSNPEVDCTVSHKEDNKIESVINKNENLEMKDVEVPCDEIVDPKTSDDGNNISKEEINTLEDHPDSKTPISDEDPNKEKELQSDAEKGEKEPISTKNEESTPELCKEPFDEKSTGDPEFQATKNKDVIPKEETNVQSDILEPKISSPDEKESVMVEVTSNIEKDNDEAIKSTDEENKSLSNTLPCDADDSTELQKETNEVEGGILKEEERIEVVEAPTELHSIDDNQTEIKKAPSDTEKEKGNKLESTDAKNIAEDTKDVESNLDEAESKLEIADESPKDGCKNTSSDTQDENLTCNIAEKKIDATKEASIENKDTQDSDIEGTNEKNVLIQEQNESIESNRDQLKDESKEIGHDEKNTPDIDLDFEAKIGNNTEGDVKSKSDDDDTKDFTPEKPHAGDENVSLKKPDASPASPKCLSDVSNENQDLGITESEEKLNEKKVSDAAESLKDNTLSPQEESQESNTDRKQSIISNVSEQEIPSTSPRGELDDIPIKEDSTIEVEPKNYEEEPPAEKKSDTCTSEVEENGSNNTESRVPPTSNVTEDTPEEISAEQAQTTSPTKDMDDTTDAEPGVDAMEKSVDLKLKGGDENVPLLTKEEDIRDATNEELPEDSEKSQTKLVSTPDKDELESVGASPKIVEEAKEEQIEMTADTLIENNETVSKLPATECDNISSNEKHEPVLTENVMQTVDALPEEESNDKAISVSDDKEKNDIEKEEIIVPKEAVENDSMTKEENSSADLGGDKETIESDDDKKLEGTDPIETASSIISLVTHGLPAQIPIEETLKDDDSCETTTNNDEIDKTEIEEGVVEKSKETISSEESTKIMEKEDTTDEDKAHCEEVVHAALAPFSLSAAISSKEENEKAEQDSKSSATTDEKTDGSNAQVNDGIGEYKDGDTADGDPKSNDKSVPEVVADCVNNILESTSSAIDAIKDAINDEKSENNEIEEAGHQGENGGNEVKDAIVVIDSDAKDQIRTALQSSSDSKPCSEEDTKQEFLNNGTNTKRDLGDEGGVPSDNLPKADDTNDKNCETQVLNEETCADSSVSKEKTETKDQLALAPLEKTSDPSVVSDCQNVETKEDFDQLDTADSKPVDESSNVIDIKVENTLEPTKDLESKINVNSSEKEEDDSLDKIIEATDKTSEEIDIKQSPISENKSTKEKINDDEIVEEIKTDITQKKDDSTEKPEKTESQEADVETMESNVTEVRNQEKDEDKTGETENKNEISEEKDGNVQEQKKDSEVESTIVVSDENQSMVEKQEATIIETSKKETNASLHDSLDEDKDVNQKHSEEKLDRDEKAEKSSTVSLDEVVVSTINPASEAKIEEQVEEKIEQTNISSESEKETSKSHEIGDNICVKQAVAEVLAPILVPIVLAPIEDIEKLEQESKSSNPKDEKIEESNGLIDAATEESEQKDSEKEQKDPQSDDKDVPSVIADSVNDMLDTANAVIDIVKDIITDEKEQPEILPEVVDQIEENQNEEKKKDVATESDSEDKKPATIQESMSCVSKDILIEDKKETPLEDDAKTDSKLEENLNTDISSKVENNDSPCENDPLNGKTSPDIGINQKNAVAENKNGEEISPVKLSEDTPDVLDAKSNDDDKKEVAIENQNMKEEIKDGDDMQHLKGAEDVGDINGDAITPEPPLDKSTVGLMEENDDTDIQDTVEKCDTDKKPLCCKDETKTDFIESNPESKGISANEQPQCIPTCFVEEAKEDPVKLAKGLEGLKSILLSPSEDNVRLNGCTESENDLDIQEAVKELAVEGDFTFIRRLSNAICSVGEEVVVKNDDEVEHSSSNVENPACDTEATPCKTDTGEDKSIVEEVTEVKDAKLNSSDESLNPSSNVLSQETQSDNTDISAVQETHYAKDDSTDSAVNADLVQSDIPDGNDKLTCDDKNPNGAETKNYDIDSNCKISDSPEKLAVEELTSQEDKEDGSSKENDIVQQESATKSDSDESKVQNEDEDTKMSLKETDDETENSGSKQSPTRNVCSNNNKDDTSEIKEKLPMAPNNIVTITETVETSVQPLDALHTDTPSSLVTTTLVTSICSTTAGNRDDEKCEKPTELSETEGIDEKVTDGVAQTSSQESNCAQTEEPDKIVKVKNDACAIESSDVSVVTTSAVITTTTNGEKIIRELSEGSDSHKLAEILDDAKETTQSVISKAEESVSDFITASSNKTLTDLSAASSGNPVETSEKSGKGDIVQESITIVKQSVSKPASDEEENSLQQVITSVVSEKVVSRPSSAVLEGSPKKDAKITDITIDSTTFEEVTSKGIKIIDESLERVKVHLAKEIELDPTALASVTSFGPDVTESYVTEILGDKLDPKDEKIEALKDDTKLKDMDGSPEAQKSECSEESNANVQTVAKEVEEKVAKWGEPLNLPSPIPPPSNTNTRPANQETSGKTKERSSRSDASQSPVYLDLAYVPYHGDSHYTDVEFFKRVRARYYVFSGVEPCKEVFNALLEGKKTWENKELEVTIIPTYDSDVLGYWVAENEEALMENRIDLAPSASRCTINLQDHETSCAAYRLEF